MALISDDYFTIGELAALKGVSKRTVYNWVKSGLAPFHEPFGGRLCFRRKEAEAFRPPQRGKRPKA